MEIVIPQRADQSAMLDFGLVALTEAIAQIAPDTVGAGLLGGEFGYGANFENDVFAMRTYYWGDCDCGYEQKDIAWSESHEHAPECYQRRVVSDMTAAGGKPSAFSKTYVDRPQNVGYDEWRKIEARIRRKWCKHFGLSFPSCCAIHCTCDYDKEWKVFRAVNDHLPTCSLELPNFRHKASGFEVRWYKWIGRDMQTSGDADLRRMFAECMDSLSRAT